MKIEEQVVSLELVKQLKEMGYPQEDSLYYWDLQHKSIHGGIVKNENKYFCAAPTVAELGEELPWEIDTEVCLEIYKIDDEWQVGYSKINSDTWNCNEIADTFANAMAKMWLYLKKKGLIK